MVFSEEDRERERKFIMQLECEDEETCEEETTSNNDKIENNKKRKYNNEETPDLNENAQKKKSNENNGEKTILLEKDVIPFTPISLSESIPNVKEALFKIVTTCNVDAFFIIVRNYEITIHGTPDLRDVWENFKDNITKGVDSLKGRKRQKGIETQYLPKSTDSIKYIEDEGFRISELMNQFYGLAEYINKTEIFNHSHLYGVNITKGNFQAFGSIDMVRVFKNIEKDFVKIYTENVRNRNQK